MKKSAIIIVWGVILCTSVFIVVHMLYYTKVQIETPTLIHKSFEGTMKVTPHTHILLSHWPIGPIKQNDLLLLKTLYLPTIQKVLLQSV